MNTDQYEEDKDGGRRKSPSVAIADIADTIASTITARMSDKNHANTLVVNLGENHVDPYHVVAETHLMAELKAQNIPFICALEREENKVATALSQFSRIQNIPKAINTLHESNMLEQFERMALIRSGAVLNSPLARTMQLDFIKNNNIPYHLVDADRVHKKGDTILDLNSDKAEQALVKAEKILGENTASWKRILRAIKSPDIPTTSTKGTLARNIHMIDACEDLFKSTQDVRLILLFTGAAHTKGNQGLPADSPAAHTLAHLSNQASFDYIGVELGLSKPVPDFDLIQDKIMRTPLIPLTADELFDPNNEARDLTGTTALGHLKEEERKISALSLAWIAPYRNKLLDAYVQNTLDFDTTVNALTRLEH